MAEDTKLIDSAEIEEMQDRIEALKSEEAMDAGVLDGYLTATALNPAKPSEEDVLPFVFSASGDPEALPDDERLLELIRMRMREIKAALNAGGGLDPVIFPLVDDEGKEVTNEEGIEAVVPWAAGFMMGATQWPDEVTESDATQKALIPIAPAWPLKTTSSRQTLKRSTRPPKTCARRQRISAKRSTKWLRASSASRISMFPMNPSAARLPASAETIRARAEAERNSSSAAAKRPE